MHQTPACDSEWMWADKPYSYLQAWLDIQRDETILQMTRREIEKRWKWGSSRVTKFFRLLEKDGLMECVLDEQANKPKKKVLRTKVQPEGMKEKRPPRTKVEQVNKPEKEPYGDNGNVYLTSDELNKIVRAYGETKTFSMIGQLDRYKHVAKYESHYLTILSWIRKEKNKMTTKEQRNVEQLKEWMAKQ